MVFIDVIGCITQVVTNGGIYFVFVVSASVKGTLGFAGNQRGENVESFGTSVHSVRSSHSLLSHTMCMLYWLVPGMAMEQGGTNGRAYEDMKVQTVSFKLE